MRIVYFDIDCLRPDHLDCYGYGRETAPAISRIAREGVRFSNYHCQSSPCVPSRAGLFSGRFGVHNGVIHNYGAGAQFRIADQPYMGPEPDNEMLVRQLRRHGYETYSFSNFADRHCARWFSTGWSSLNTINLKGGEESAEEVNKLVLPWIEWKGSDEDYFLHINYWDAHRCYSVSEEFASDFRGTPLTLDWPDEEAIQSHQSLTGLFTANTQFRHGRSPFPLMPGAVNNRKDFKLMIDGYDASIRYVDAHIQQVLDRLDKNGGLDDTAIIISADHGDAFGEHGIYSDHVCADACIHRVPLIIRWPRASVGGIESSGLHYNTDLGPTLCELLGIPAPCHWDGKSFAGAVRGEGDPGRDHLVWDHGLYTVQRAVRTPQHLFIVTHDDFGYQAFDRESLHDLIQDPYQTANLIHDLPDVAAECRDTLARWESEQMPNGAGLHDPLKVILDERRSTAQRS